MPLCDQTGTPAILFDAFFHFRSSIISGSASRISARMRASVSSRHPPASRIGVAVFGVALPAVCAELDFAFALPAVRVAVDFAFILLAAPRGKLDLASFRSRPALARLARRCLSVK